MRRGPRDRGCTRGARLKSAFGTSVPRAWRRSAHRDVRLEAHRHHPVPGVRVDARGALASPKETSSNGLHAYARLRTRGQASGWPSASRLTGIGGLSFCGPIGCTRKLPDRQAPSTSWITHRSTARKSETPGAAVSPRRCDRATAPGDGRDRGGDDGDGSEEVEPCGEVTEPHAPSDGANSRSTIVPRYRSGSSSASFRSRNQARGMAKNTPAPRSTMAIDRARRR